MQAAVSWTSGSDGVQTVLHSDFCLSVAVQIVKLKLL